MKPVVQPGRMGKGRLRELFRRKHGLKRGFGILKLLKTHHFFGQDIIKDLGKIPAEVVRIRVSVDVARFSDQKKVSERKNRPRSSCGTFCYLI